MAQSQRPYYSKKILYKPHFQSQVLDMPVIRGSQESPSSGLATSKSPLQITERSTEIKRSTENNISLQMNILEQSLKLSECTARSVSQL